MGRQQAFDTAAAVESARDLFWQHGYDAVSLSDLERATGLGRSSLYHAFGSKHGLFDAAVENYLDTIIRPRIAPLLDGSNTPVQAAASLVAYFTDLAATVAALPADSPRQGCLLVGAAPGIAGHDEPVRAVVATYHAELVRAFSAALDRAGLDRAAVDRAALNSDDDASVGEASGDQASGDQASDDEAEAAAISASAAATAARARLLTSLSVSAFTLAKVDKRESIELLQAGAAFATEWTAGTAETV